MEQEEMQQTTKECLVMDLVQECDLPVRMRSTLQPLRIMIGDAFPSAGVGMSCILLRPCTARTLTDGTLMNIWELMLHCSFCKYPDGTAMTCFTTCMQRR